MVGDVQVEEREAFFFSVVAFSISGSLRRSATLYRWGGKRDPSGYEEGWRINAKWPW